MVHGRIGVVLASAMLADCRRAILKPRTADTPLPPQR
jgi:hypothetical protein